MEKQNWKIWMRSKICTGIKFKILTIISILLLVGFSSTAAYLMLTTNSETNAFSVGTINLTIEETQVPDPNQVEWGIDTKKVQIKNQQEKDSVAGVVRVMLVPTVTKGGVGQSAGFNSISEPVNGQMNLGDIVLHFASDWASNWFFKDGYFYYREVLEPGQSTSILLTGVTYVNQEAAAKYELSKIQIEVLSDILQATGQAPMQEWGISMVGTVVAP